MISGLKIEKEGCGSIEHIRVQPKRMIGNGHLVNLQKSKDDSSTMISEDQSTTTYNFDESAPSFFEESGEGKGKIADSSEKSNPDTNVKKTKSWAMLVNPKVASSSSQIDTVQNDLSSNFASVTLSAARDILDVVNEGKTDDNSEGGQFSDAEDDDYIDIEESSDDGDEFASIGDDFSDEECDVYILEPDEVEEKKRMDELSKAESPTGEEQQELIKLETEKQEIFDELNMEFPSLVAASTVPYEGSDDECEDVKQLTQSDRLKIAEELEQNRKEESLRPMSKSGKLFNSLGKYKKIASKKGVEIAATTDEKNKVKVDTNTFSFKNSGEKDEEHVRAGPTQQKGIQSRIMTGSGMTGQSNEVDDDGEGWVTSTNEIIAMKATGTLDPFRSDHNKQQSKRVQENLPAKECRTACATTDFAMQNVILQMNLELLTINGVRVRKLKSWVQRCSTCTEVYTSVETTRLFCGKCGSSSIQRVAASVDGKTGRLKLHLSKKYQHKLRGTKYQMPKPGKQNRFRGDLVLSEDQLMYGALSQRVKQTKSKNVKASQSIFGADIASTVGCHADLSKSGDIRVGFGRKNPNSTKFGRERRGKKKTSGEKACGLRRY